LSVAIWGAGAVGIGLASALAGPDAETRLIGRDPSTLRAIREHGIHRSGHFGEIQIPPEALRVESDPSSLETDPPDWLLICTKAFATQDIARPLAAMSRLLAGRTRLVLCQNGWGNETAFLPFWPITRLFHARVITGFQRISGFEVVITAHAAPVALGNLFGYGASELSELAERLSRGGIPAETREDMESVLWAKMLYNCALNPLGALTNRRYGELAEDPVTRLLMQRVVEEIFEVLGQTGFRVPWPTPSAYLETFHAELIPVTAAHESSMLQDLRAGRQTEIEALCGAVERLAAQHSVATPVVSALATLVRAAQERAGRPDSA
jgi:2-dehydropantoate 2-reductase